MRSATWISLIAGAIHRRRSRAVRQRARAFEASYREAIESVVSLNCPVTLCTIYNGNLPQEQAALARVALTIFNDAILRTAFERSTGVIDLQARLQRSTRLRESDRTVRPWRPEDRERDCACSRGCPGGRIVARVEVTPQELRTP